MNADLGNNYFGTIASFIGMAFGLDAEIMFSKTFNSWTGKDGIIRSQNWGGNGATGGKIKFASSAANNVKIGGAVMGTIGIIGSYVEWNNDKISDLHFGANVFMGVVGLTGIKGAIWSFSFEMGKHYGPNKWFRREQECVACP